MTDITEDDADICGLCGEPGADKIPHSVYWPGEQGPDGTLSMPSASKRDADVPMLRFQIASVKDFCGRFQNTGDIADLAVSLS
jgi:hypothetical protein